MEISIRGYKCDVCDKVVDDYKKFRGWIHIDTDGLKISDGRGYLRYCDSLCYDWSEGLDFCSIRCFIKWLLFSDKELAQDTEYNSFIQSFKIVLKESDCGV